MTIANSNIHQCKSCILDQPQIMPCRVDVVWGSFMENPHLSEMGWIHKIKNGSEFLVYDTTGAAHPIVVYSGLEDRADGTRPPSSLLLAWRYDVFGSRNVLTTLENSLHIKFRIQDQTHWFDGAQAELILQPDRVVPLRDTAGRLQKVIRPGTLSANKMQAFLQWKAFLCEVAKRLLGVENLDTQYKILPDASWEFNKIDPYPQTVDGSTLLQDGDWDYDANPASRLEDYQRGWEEDV